MGVFDFIKKPKVGTTGSSMELPPIPKLEGLEGFPELPNEELPPFPDTSLPPLPSDVPSAVPPQPREGRLESPRMEMSRIPQIVPSPAPKRVEQRPMPMFPEMPPEFTSQAPMQQMQEIPPSAPETHDLTFPTMPEAPHEEFIPDRIPPLEDLPEPPRFREEAMQRAEERELPPEPIEEHIPFTYTMPEETRISKRKVVSGPLYIRTDTVRAIIDDLEQVKMKFNEEDDLFFRIADIKNAQDQTFEKFRQLLEDTQRKLLFIDRSLFETR